MKIAYFQLFPKKVFIVQQALSKRKIAIVVIELFMIMAILIDMQGCSDKIANTDEQESLADAVNDKQEEIANTDEQESLADAVNDKQEEAVASDEKYRNGVSSDYQTYRFQMDTNTVLQHYYDKGYENVWLFYHEVKAPENGNIGDGGTVDVISLEASYEDKEGYFYIVDTYGVIYAYWNETIGWKHTFEQLGDPQYDFSKFNNTYWKVKTDRCKVTLANLVIEEYSEDEDIEEYSEDGDIEVFVEFENFDTFRYRGDYEFVSDAVLGKLFVVFNGNVHEAEFICDAGYGHKMGLAFNERANEWQIDIGVDVDVARSSGICWSTGSQSEIEAITKEEFEEALNGIIVLDKRNDNVQEKSSEESDQNEMESVNRYGTYGYDNGLDAVLSADVGFYTGDGSDYIRLEALSYGDRYLAEFEGVLIWVEGNAYEAEDGYGTKLRCTFDERGMLVTVESAEWDDFYILEGYYPKTGELNLDEVG